MAPAEITPQLRLAIDRGLAFLIKNQKPSGSFAGSESYPVAVDGLAVLAFLSGGNTLTVGPYTGPMRKGLKNLLSFQNQGGYFDDGESRMYGHGFATLCLAELYGMSPEEKDDLREALKRAVRVIELSQSPDGGWDYQPHDQFGGWRGRGESDTSITVCQAMAIRAARNLGIKVDGGVVERARTYIRKAQNADGGFCYRLSREGGWGFGSQFARSAAGVCILYSLATPEEYGSSELTRGYDYLLEHHRVFSPFQYYAHYYCAQAMFQAGGKYWGTYFPYLREWLLARQRADGSWAGGGVELAPLEVSAQATAMALIALQVPFRFLPILER
jgi:hypothetical protein